MAARDVTAARGLAVALPATRRRVGVETGAQAERGRIAGRAAAGGLILAMAVGSFALWTAVPLGGLWLASQLAASFTQLSAAPALVAGVGIPLAMGLGARGLARLERRYNGVTGTTRSPRVPGYRRSVSDSRSTAEPSVLDKIMMASVLAAVVVFAGWFFVFSGSSLPA